MSSRVTRRALLATALSSVASAALANAPLTSPRPVARPGSVALEAQVESVAEIIDAANLGGTVGFVLADLASGKVIETNAPDVGLPPASTAKAVTALYALTALGPDYRFTTELRATGPVVNGTLDGDLVLVGGGDPTFVTDQLAQLVDQMVEAGITKINGDFYVWDRALPYREEIDPPQMDHLGYNPSVSGLNLNFNRVHFEWRRANGKYSVALDARSETRKPDVYTSRMRIVDRALPVYTYDQVGGVDEWTVARTALGNEGSRWLPVRNPAYYAGDVFQTLARSRGVPLPPPQKTNFLPEGEAIATFTGAPMAEVLRDMLRFSTNLTAEAVGMTATGAPESLPDSAAAMNAFVADRAKVRPAFKDHSGLSDESQVSARQMVALLQSEGAREALVPILKDHTLTDENGRAIKGFPAVVKAKTGTLNFVSTLAGYITTESGTQLAFTIFTANPIQRAAGKASGDEVPIGSAGWNRRSKRLQQRLLQRWAVRYDGYLPPVEAPLAPTQNPHPPLPTQG